MIARTLLAALALALAALTAIPSPRASAQSDHPASQDPADPDNAPRDVSHYNLDKKHVAIEGYDPVAYFPEGGGKPVKGKKQFEHTHRGVVYRFSAADHLDRFKQNPRRYQPTYGGWCASAMADGGRKVEISPKNFRVTDGRLFLFYEDVFTDAQDYWKKDEPAATTAADDHWRRLTKEEPRLNSEPDPSPGAPDVPDPDRPRSAK